MTDSYICGICKVEKTYDEDFPALSRKDNKTDLCSDCGNKEAMIEYMEKMQNA
jgi:hypothetical protein